MKILRFEISNPGLEHSGRFLYTWGILTDGNLMKKQLLLFDFDGTIADTFLHIVNIGNRLADEFKFNPIRPQDIEPLKNNSVEETIKYLKVPVLKVPSILLRARQELHKEIKQVQPIKHLPETLQELREAGYELGIITTNSAKNVSEFLRHHNLDVFDFISSTSKVFGKSQSLKRLIRQKQRDLSDVFYVGDEIRDILAAQKTGIAMIAVGWGFNSKDALARHNPDYLIHSPQDLLDVCANL